MTGRVPRSNIFFEFLLNKLINKYVLFQLALVLLNNSYTYGQTLPVSDQLMQDYFRIRQIQGGTDSSLSLTVRPISAQFVDTAILAPEYNYAPVSLFPASKHFQFKVFPLSTVVQINTHNPYGWNDGLMIPAKGYQQHVSGGFFLRVGPLSIQVKPEFIYAANPRYLDTNDQIASNGYSNYIAGGYGADLPAYHEAKNFNALDMGQSSLRINVGPASFGVSKENLWWGPGRRNSLLMSNSARGFKHLTLNTNRPITSPIGSFEGQIVSGRLENSNSPLNRDKNQEWRYLSGMVIDYQPKWISGLFVGLTRVFQMYNSDIQGFSDYFPLLQPFEKRRTEEDSKIRDQLTSVFARYIFRGSDAEVYAELGRNDHSFNSRDFLQEPGHSRAYIVGFQKLVTLPSSDENILVAAEITQLSQSINRLVRSSGTWYVHEINQGYTNSGEVIGAGTGPGGNLQSLEISWLKGFKKIGLQLERIEHNRDFYEEMIDLNGSYDGQWVDLSAGLVTSWDYKNFLFRGQLSGIQSLNYIWQTRKINLPQKHVFNFHANVGLNYYFK